MDTIVVSDIFGRTPALEKFCNDLHSTTVKIVDPFDGYFMGFKTESEAYSYFIENIGLEKYSEILINKFLNSKEKNTLIGFSIGASAIWKASNVLSKKVIFNSFCFYGSQIRNFTNIEPNFNVNIILPKEEETFSVHELEKMITHKQKVTVYNSNYLHGFMNLYSNNYNKNGYNMYLKWLSQNAI